MRVVIFVIHLILALWLVSLGFKDTACHNKATYTQQNDTSLVRMPFQSFVLGSWVNVIMTLAVVEWIAASFALYFMDLPNYLDPTNDENLGLHSTILMSTAWNLVFLVVLWMKHDVLNIPPNNIFVFVLAILGAIAVQNLMGRAQIDPKKDAAPRSYEPVFDTNIFFSAKQSNHKHLEFHDRSYANHLDLSSRGVVCRMCESAFITPLIYMALIALVPGSLTWAAQVAFAAQIVLNFNMILANFTTENTSVVYIYRTNALLLLLVIATVLYGPNFFLFFGSNTPIPMYVRALYFLIVLAWAAYIAAFLMDYNHRFRHDLLDWIGLLVKVILISVVATHICDVC